MLSFEDLTLKNWKKYEAQVLNSELVFHEAIQTPADQYMIVLRSRNCIAKIALLDKQYIGVVLGYRPQMSELSDHGLKEIYKDNNLIYVFDLVIDPPYQGKGYGLALMREFIEEARKRGFPKIAGHFRPNGSAKIIQKLGGKVIRVCHNWEDTGEDYLLCELLIL